MKKRLALSAAKGFSVVEVMLAVALFMIFATGMVGAVLHGLDNNRLAGEQVIANQYAAEGLEATRSINNQNYASLGYSNGTGVAIVNGVWTLSGNNNIFDKYTRVLTISTVQRDSSGNIVASGGTLDPDIKKVTSTVSWNVNSARQNSVVLTTYLSSWKTSGRSLPTCNSYSTQQGYASGSCRENSQQCTVNNETYLSGGDISCVTYNPGDSSHDTCCALAGATPTPTLTPTPTPGPTVTPTPTLTPTPTPTPTPALTTCNQYCLSTYSRTGLCARSTSCNSPKINAGRIYECNTPNYCCCQ